METARRRGRSKSSTASENDNASNEENSVEQLAENLNGEKIEDIEKTVENEHSSEANADGRNPEIDETEETHQNRKRKASEMKSEDENANEETVDNKASQPLEVSVTDNVEFKEIESKELDCEVKEDKKPPETKTDPTDDLNIPPKQMLGKGKRARIPNKRYSDIMLSPQTKVNKASENGSERNESESDSTMDVDIRDDETSSMSGGVSPTSSSKKMRMSVDTTDPKYLKPFDLGWKRELVWRGDSSIKRQGDIYYYTPTGRKIRSMRELAENLKTKDLTLDNFTFIKDSLGTDDPEKEIIRDAKTKSSASAVAVNKKVANTKVSKSPRSPKLPASPKPPTRSASAKATLSKIETSDEIESSNSKVKSTKNNFKIKLPGRKDKKGQKDDEEVETSSTTSRAGASRRSAKWSKASGASSKSKKRLPKVVTDTKEDNKVNDFMQTLSYGYNTLLYVFQYLKVQDLLRAGCVCTMWRDIANHPSLWKTVRMKNSQVHSFEGLANTLAKHSTHHLDLRKMLLPSNGEDLWSEFSAVIGKSQSLRRIELCRCPAAVVEKLAVSNPALEVINALTIKCESMSLDPLKSLVNIKELRLKSTCGLTLTSDIEFLRELKQLKNLSLTSIKDLDRLNLNVIAELTNLESLDLGECSDFPQNFGSDILIKLEKLEKLRLEKGQGNCHTFEILDAVKDMKNLEQLELVNFDIKAGFDKALGACLNIKKLLIIPTYISQSATTNHMVLGGVLRLQKTLSHFVWGVTLELLRVTELFVDQCEEPKKDKKPPGNGDSIPVLKPVPLLSSDESVEIPPAHDPPQVEILALPSLQKLLMQNLPSTRVKILKIPFHATWRQSITDSVN